MELRTGHRLFLVRPRQRRDDFAQWLLVLRHRCPRIPVALLLDENSSHLARVNQTLAEQLRIHLFCLPKRSPHLNPMDHLWRWGKQHLAANRQEPDIYTLARWFVDVLRSLSTEQSLRLAGVLSPRFWLRRVLSN